MSELTNHEIREKLLKFNYDCGPVTDTTREVHLKKLESLESGSVEKKIQVTDEELRSQLMSYGVSAAPITSTNRHIYARRLEKLKKSKNLVPEVKTYNDECEPMEID